MPAPGDQNPDAPYHNPTQHKGPSSTFNPSTQPMTQLTESHPTQTLKGSTDVNNPSRERRFHPLHSGRRAPEGASPPDASLKGSERNVRNNIPPHRSAPKDSENFPKVDREKSQTCRPERQTVINSTEDSDRDNVMENYAEISSAVEQEPAPQSDEKTNANAIPSKSYASAANSTKSTSQPPPPDPQSLSGGQCPQPAPGGRPHHGSQQHAQDSQQGTSGAPPGLPPGPKPNPAERVQDEQSNHAQQGGSEAREVQPGVFAKFAGAWGSSGASAPRDKARDEYNKLYADFQRQREELHRARGENQSLRQKYNEIDYERQRFRDTASSLHHELGGVQRQLEEYKALSETRGKELLGAQVFLTKADSISISEVVEKVSALNDETFQAAASVQDSFIHEDYGFPQEVLDVAYKCACDILGQPIAKLLLDNPGKPDVNPLLVQVVFQILISRFCTSKIEQWFLGGQETNDFLSSLYGEIRRSENQAVSGRWRALTRIHTRATSDDWTTDFLGELESIKRISGWNFSSPAKQEAFIQKLGPIFKAVKGIRIALGEQFTSADIEVAVAGANIPFSPQWMEDAWSDARQPGGKRREEVVAGTTGIGLKRLVPHHESQGAEDYTAVLPPKIILYSSLEEIVNPPPRESSNRKRRQPPRGDDQTQGGLGGVASRVKNAVMGP